MYTFTSIKKIFLVVLGFELRAFTYKANPLLLEPHVQFIIGLVILEMGSWELFAQVVHKP
jgi:hypothetical protein